MDGIQFAPGKEARREPKANEVVTEWRCREPHPDCEARSWQFYKLVPKGEVADRLRDWNTYSTFFEYRAKPADLKTTNKRKVK